MNMLSKLYFEGVEVGHIKFELPITLLAAYNLSFCYVHEEWPNGSQTKIHTFWVIDVVSLYKWI